MKKLTLSLLVLFMACSRKEDKYIKLQELQTQKNQDILNDMKSKEKIDSLEEEVRHFQNN